MLWVQITSKQICMLRIKYLQKPSISLRKGQNDEKKKKKKTTLPPLRNFHRMA